MLISGSLGASNAINFHIPDRNIPGDQRSHKAVFDQFGGKFYSIDFMHGDDGWYMVEMNDRPGMPAFFQDTNGAVKEFHEKLAAMIAKELA